MSDSQYQTVTVPGVGDIDFPTSMSDDDIRGVIKRHYPAKPAAPTGAPGPQQGTPLPSASAPKVAAPPLPSNYKPITAQIPQEIPWVKEHIDPILNRPLARDIVNANPI